MRRSARERGAVTAELALGLPLLVAVTLGLVWLLGLGAAQLRMVDAARETARAAARGDTTEAALARGREVAPAGTVITLRRGDGRVVVSAEGRARGPGGLFAAFPAVTLRADAVAADEDGP